MLVIDGSEGEGGGQVLRTALSLSMITGKPFKINNIRGKRPKPGLMRQHLVAVDAAKEISNADVGGNQLGSTCLEFIPKEIEGGDFSFAIGSAGSCTLVLQTILPALLYAKKHSTVRISGGTHNPMAPPAQFLQRSFLPILRKMGADIDLTIDRFGFYPAGGGELRLGVSPCELKPIEMMTRGTLINSYAESFVAGLSNQICAAELKVIQSAFQWNKEQLIEFELPADQGPGNALLITIEYDHVTEVFCALGKRGLSSEMVAKNVISEMTDYCVAGDSVADEYLADQLLLPMALSGQGIFTASVISQHTLTNAEIIKKFIDVDITFTETDELSICKINRCR
jgi:RNA 3'-terminal phosphate cyclase (ATP)